MSASLSSPLLLDIADFERDILLLEKTNKELKEMIDRGDVLQASEVPDIRFIIVENEFAIQAKLKARKETRDLLPDLAKVEDLFHLERVDQQMQMSTTTTTQNRDARAIQVGVTDDDNITVVDGIFL